MLMMMDKLWTLTILTLVGFFVAIFFGKSLGVDYDSISTIAMILFFLIAAQAGRGDFRRKPDAEKPAQKEQKK